MCSAEDCERPAIARGMCHMHYKRWRNRNPDQIYAWRQSLEERFWKNVRKTGSCWQWTGRLYLGYGGLYCGSRIDQSRERIAAHRISYELHIGPIPAGADIDHLCRNRGCVNPKHLEAVSRRENILRGEGITAKNARKTHCPRGHAYDEANTRRSKSGTRKCFTCRQMEYRRWELRSKGQFSDGTEESGGSQAG